MQPQSSHLSRDAAMWFKQL